MKELFEKLAIAFENDNAKEVVEITALINKLMGYETKKHPIYADVEFEDE